MAALALGFQEENSHRTSLKKSNRRKKRQPPPRPHCTFLPTDLQPLCPHSLDAGTQSVEMLLDSCKRRNPEALSHANWPGSARSPGEAKQGGWVAAKWLELSRAHFHVHFHSRFKKQRGGEAVPKIPKWASTRELRPESRGKVLWPSLVQVALLCLRIQKAASAG